MNALGDSMTTVGAQANGVRGSGRKANVAWPGRVGWSAGGLGCCLAVLLLLCSGAAWAQADTLALELPALSAAQVESRAHADFTTYPLIVEEIDQRGGIKGNISSTRTVEGELLQTTYSLNNSAAEKLLRRISAHLSQAGYKQLYACDGRACGPTFTLASPGYRAAAKLFSAPTQAQHYRAFKKPGSLGDRYVAVQVAQEGATAPVHVQLDVMQVEPRVVGAITVNAAKMAQQLQTRGRVALYGLFFETDSAEIKPASRSTLAEIAKLMAQKPDLKLLVVGHTDSTGTFKYNLKLSRERAHAVVDALVHKYGVDPQRLKPWGVSYAAPRASNANAIGRSRNRRVELVIW